MSLRVLVVDDAPDAEMRCAPGMRRHIKSCAESSRDDGREEIMEVLKPCTVLGAQARNLGVPILAEETAAVSDAVARP
jgi:hypothetical protein